MEFSLRKVGVIGAGMMRSEIALCFAMADIEAILKDINLELAKKGKDRSSLALDKLIKKGRFSPEERELILSRTAPSDKRCGRICSESSTPCYVDRSKPSGGRRCSLSRGYWYWL